LFQDTTKRVLRHVISRLARDGNFAGSQRMPELAMTTPRSLFPPALRFHQLDYIPDFHEVTPGATWLGGVVLQWSLSL